MTIISWDGWRGFYKRQRQRVQEQRRSYPQDSVLTSLTPEQLEQDRREEFESLTYDTITRNALYPRKY